MNEQSAEFVEVFLQEASEHLQFLREYSGILQDAYPQPEDVERLFISGHSLGGTSASYGFPLFAEIAGKLAHIFQYAMNSTIGPDASGPLVEFISEAIAVLESDLLMISANGIEAAEDIDAFKQRFPFAFQAAVEPDPEGPSAPVADATPAAAAAAVEKKAPPLPLAPILPQDDEVPSEILEFFVPEAEEHLQIVTDCLLSLETNPSPEEIHRLLRAIHTIKGSAAQVGWQRISRVAHRTEDLVGRLRDGALRPSAEIVDICLESVDQIKKFLYRQWPDEQAIQSGVRALFSRIDRLAPEEIEEKEDAPLAAAAQASVETPSEAMVQSASTGLAPVLAPVILPPVQHMTEAEIAEADELEEIAQAERAREAELKKEPAAMPQSKSVRVALDRLDRMMNVVGELVINRTRMLGRVAELERLADVLNFSKGRMQDKVAEFQEKYEFSRISVSPAPRISMGENFPLRGGYSSYSHSFDHSLAEFSELEMDRYDDFNILSRSLTEISADITEVLTQLDGFVRRVDSDIDEFTGLAHRLQDEITQARMVPIGNLYTRIARTVRDAAKATKKKVEITLSGAETELDNNIIQQISDPLLHLVRNAVAHGVEREEERYLNGKSDHGNITVRAYHRGNHIYIEVEDDGRGIDFERVRQTAVESGSVSAEGASGLTERDLLDLLFRPGFSTAPRKTELAGRGVGLDVVRSNLNQLNGEIEVETEKLRGTRFTLKVPLTLIISQALFVRCGRHMFALPLSFVEEIRRLRVTDIEEVGNKLLTRVRDSVTEIVRLDHALGLETFEPVNGFYRMVIINVAGRQVGLMVEEVIRKDEIVIKNLGEYLRNVKMFPGATIAPDGSLILLIDVNRLVVGEAIERRPLMTSSGAARVFAPGAVAVAQGMIPPEAIDRVPNEKVVVLVDDSISVRKFVGRMLEKAGYRVRLAADGLEALEIVSQIRCDLVVSDLEMPRTNGYELLSHLRQDPATRNIPVMVVTSRAGAKHRDRAIKEGAVDFMVKPVQEDKFITAVTKLIGSGTDTVAARAMATVQ
ncbi:MAG TPA: response regulator [Candidatus Saccharimonadales bacterium]|jgi:chemosensory pili system protein ChpA (sensor histidine kinase/response regulator)|nr:response regulator [Candidatus Saccharimonadales bacterium]